MAGVNEILGSTLIVKNKSPSLEPFICRSFIRPQNIPSSTTLLYPCKKRVMSPITKAVPAVDFAQAEPTTKEQVPDEFVKVTAVVTVRNDRAENMKEMVLGWLDSQKSDKGVVLQLVSTDIDPRKRELKLSKEAALDCWSGKLDINAEQFSQYKVEIEVEANFGLPGAILVTNKYQKELYLHGIEIDGVVYFACNSWIQPHLLHPEKRIFFSNKAYLPSETPAGLRKLRERELKQLRGNGEGMRRSSDRIYDFDVYNDLGFPDKGNEFERPIFGGKSFPYPRRCRSGRPPAQTDGRVESPVDESMPMYVPRDETFEDSKMKCIFSGQMRGILNNFIRSLKDISSDCGVIRSFTEISDLYKESSSLQFKLEDEIWKKPHLPISILTKHVTQEIFKFDPPKITSGNCTLQDDEFGRLMLGGTNPLSIERLRVFPPASKLDSNIFGPQQSAIKEEHIISHLDGLSVEQALEENKLFILDYHDIYLPFLDRINAKTNRKAYATRTIFFLTQMGTLKPIVIELSLPPPANSNSQSKKVLTPPVDATATWQWQLAKAHVCSNDSAAHEIIHHWLRTHACLEPFIIAAHRQFSVMHPIYKLLRPHMRYTVQVNAQARSFLLSAGGILETLFSTAEHTVEISSSVYQNWWRFDMESLPADLVRRGMAVRDPAGVHGLRLMIEDYPYANDGLLLWSAIETLVRTYVKYYYPDPSTIQSDGELNSWYKESINVGHADVRHATWWPKLSTPDDLSSILTTLIWVGSGLHAAVNFGQYHYGGLVPIRPPYMRRLVPNEDDPDYLHFLNDPQGYLFSSLPSLLDSTNLMSMIEILSTHSPDEEYLGQRDDLSTWSGDPEIVDAFYKFSMEMRRIEREIEKRNGDPKLRNRCGAGVSPYELLMPSSGPGVTGRGVPNSVSI